MAYKSLQRNVKARPGRSYTRRSVLNSLVSNRIFAKVMSNHLGPDCHLGKLFPVVDMYSKPNHVRQNYHISNVSLELALQLSFSCQLYLFSQLSSGY